LLSSTRTAHGAPKAYHMSKTSLAYVFAVVASAAIFASTQLPARSVATLAGADWAGIAAFVGTAVLLQSIAINFATGRQGASSISFIPLFALAILFPPIVSVGAVFIVFGFAAFSARIGLLKGLFNIAQVALGLGLGARLYRYIYDLFQHTYGHAPAVNLIGFFLLVATFFTTNAVLSSVALSLFRGQPLAAAFRAVVGPRGGNMTAALLASPVVYLTVILYIDYHVLGILLTLLPAALLRRSYESQKKLVEANQDLLTALIKAVETRDPYTSGHSLRVRTLSQAIAEDMGLPAKQRDIVTNAALLHDIGKIDPLYADVLRKPHSLTPAERELIQTHAARGADMLRDLSSVDRNVVAAVRHHHERYDGKGYPDGLAGMSIPVSARIIMLSDSIDAMLSDRPYRRALAVDQVKSELMRCSALQFDPEIVDVVLNARTLEKAVSLVAEWRNAMEQQTPAVALA
jgi:putative nucleotidyltransferase with HDIG domain